MPMADGLVRAPLQVPFSAPGAGALPGGGTGAPARPRALARDGRGEPGRRLGAVCGLLARTPPGPGERVDDGPLRAGLQRRARAAFFHRRGGRVRRRGALPGLAAPVGAASDDWRRRAPGLRSGRFLEPAGPWAGAPTTSRIRAAAITPASRSTPTRRKAAGSRVSSPSGTPRGRLPPWPPARLPPSSATRWTCATPAAGAAKCGAAGASSAAGARCHRRIAGDTGYPPPAMPATFPPPSFADPLPGYAGRAGRYDECRAADGAVRPHWAEFLRQLGPDPAATLRAASDACARAVLEQDVSMNVYAGARSEPQPWPLDVVPHLVSVGDWELLSAGLRQRAHLYNTLLADLYGPQLFLRSGALPAALAMANPRFLRPCSGLGKPGGVFLHSLRRRPRPLAGRAMVGPAGPARRPLRPRLFPAEPADRAHGAAAGLLRGARARSSTGSSRTSAPRWPTWRRRPPGARTRGWCS